MKRWVGSLVRGAVAGVVAVVPMTAFMLGGKALGLTGRLPPKKITLSFLRGLGARRTPVRANALTLLNHVSVGAAFGAIYAMLRGRARSAVSARAASAGAAYGAGVWAVNYAGWIPASGIMRSPLRDRTDRQVVMLAAHEIFGVALAVVDGWLGRGDGWIRPSSAGPEEK